MSVITERKEATPVPVAISRKTGRRVGNVIIQALIVISALLVLFPLFWIMLTGFKTRLQTFSMPPAWIFTPTLENFRDVFANEVARGVGFAQVYMNSVVVAVTATIIPVLLAALAAYSFARFEFRGKNALALFVIGTRMLPPIALVVPIYLIATRLKMVDTRLALIIAYTGLNLPFATWMLRGFFTQIPRELDDAALIDGCSRIGALWRVILPLAAPGLVATALFSFILAWNDFAFALVLTTSRAVTLPVAAARFRTDEGILWGQVGAAATLVLIPVILFALFMQKWIVRGLTAGSVKG
jgi:multiple sugar transport system permease protein